MEDEIIQKIYKLTSELASQQQNNQELATSLTGQLSHLKQKAATKYTKDGQDVYIPEPLLPGQRDEVITSLKDRLEKALADQQVTLKANEELEQECSELHSLVQEYELGLKAVANKLRTHASATTEGQIRLRREYEALLNAEKVLERGGYLGGIVMLTCVNFNRGQRPHYLWRIQCFRRN
ncbi:unnamed protein product [Mucor hiemalis]